ncbi:hypothetical protein [Marinilabilia sp.]|uniref:hypothetical protein n=1 Tax=Marinilabilia sp. TaxID=2021252 RepID=UPI0025BC330E|nr:hypothetical protein [Marinilabilia sp.]
MDVKINNNPKTNNRFWYALDNAAKIFPAIITREVTSVIRISTKLMEPVQVEAFRKAVLVVEKRFPYYLVQLRKGFFWYYLEHLPHHITIETDDKECCRKFEKGDLLLRFLIWEKSISLEVSHILTDGGGAFEFLRTVLILYFKECGVAIPEDFSYKKPQEKWSEEEFEDAYKRYFKEEVPPLVRKSKAFHLPFSLNASPRFHRTIVNVSMRDIKRVAKANRVSLTVYLAAVYLYILQDVFEHLNPISKLKMSKILRVQVPVNLRNIFSSQTMRNFSLFVMPEIDLRLGHYSFEEILRSVYHQMELETEEKLINKNISRNVGSEKKIYVRSIPLFVKSLILKAKFNSLGTSQFSGVVTNLGRVDLPPEVADKIDYFVLTAPPPNKMLKISCAVVGFNERLTLCFGSVTKSHEFEERFVRFLNENKIFAESEESNQINS